MKRFTTICTVICTVIFTVCRQVTPVRPASALVGLVIAFALVSVGCGGGAHNSLFCDRQDPLCPDGLACDFAKQTCVSPAETGAQDDPSQRQRDGSAEATPSADAVPDQAGDAGDAGACGGDGSCRDGGAADADASGSCTSSEQCDNENPCTEDSCNDDGECVHAPRIGESCRTAGDKAGRCAMVGPLATCVALKAQGETCEPGQDECASGFCVDGVCCNTKCGGTCLRCDLAGHVGACTFEPAGTQSTDCGDVSLCNPGTCDGKGGCQYTAKGDKCDTCASCDGNGKCVADLTRDDDCGDGSTCGKCKAKGQCSVQASGSECGKDCMRCSKIGDKGYCKPSSTHDDCGFCHKCSSGKCVPQNNEDVKKECRGEPPCGPGACDGTGECDFSATMGVLCDDKATDIRNSYTGVHTYKCYRCNESGRCSRDDDDCACGPKTNLVCIGGRYWVDDMWCTCSPSCSPSSCSTVR